MQDFSVSQLKHKESLKNSLKPANLTQDQHLTSDK